MASPHTMSANGVRYTYAKSKRFEQKQASANTASATPMPPIAYASHANEGDASHTPYASSYTPSTAMSFQGNS